MRRIILVIAVLTLLLAACADAGTGPLDGAELPASEDDAEEPDSGEVITAEGTGLEMWEGELADADDPIVRELADDDAIPEDEVLTEDTNPKPRPPISVPIPEPLPAATGEVPMDLLEAILADAQSRLSTEASITVIRDQAVTWSDGSLGCPEPGMMYTQALVSGYWVILDADGQTLDYRASNSGGFKYCPFGGSVPTEPAGR